MRFLALALIVCGAASGALNTQRLERARDTQNRGELDRMAAEASAAASKQSGNAQAQYEAALAESYVAEVAAEFRDKERARAAAEAGMRAAERAIALNGANAEYHRVLGTLCGHAVPGGGFAAIKYGKCALDSLNKAIELDPKSALAYLGRGVGYSYLPAAFGGGVEPALRDIRKSVELNPKLADGWLWLGVTLRKANRNQEARQALTKAVELNPARVWAKEQLKKTPAK